jgi:hypothetical protein
MPGRLSASPVFISGRIQVLRVRWLKNWIARCRGRHGAVAVTIVAVGGLVSASAGQQHPQSRQRYLVHYEAGIGGRGRQLVYRTLGLVEITFAVSPCGAHLAQ